MDLRRGLHSNSMAGLEGNPKDLNAWWAVKLLNMLHVWLMETSVRCRRSASIVRTERGLDQISFLALRGFEAGAHGADMLLGTAENQATAGFALAEDGSDLGVLVCKDLAKQKDGALDRREALQPAKKSHGQRFIDADDLGRIAFGTGDDGFSC